MDYLDPNVYHKAKNANPTKVVSIVKIDPDLYDVTLKVKNPDEDAEGTVNKTFRVSLGVVQDVRQKTNQERTRLDNLITDLQAVV